MGKRLSFLTLGPSLAGSSDILMASSIAANRPLPPSPLRAGPKHSGLRMRRRTTTLAFSSTLSPTGHRGKNVWNVISEREININSMGYRIKYYGEKKIINQTIDKYGKPKKVKVFFSTTRIPANVRVTFGQKHWTALKSTSS